MGRRKKQLCPVCSRRKPDRDCPALGKRICSRCCGEMRSPSACPADCDYLVAYLARDALPLYRCLDMAGGGMHGILLARERRDRKLIVAGFLADTHEMGLKDCFTRECSKLEFRNMVALKEREAEDEFEELTLEDCRRIVEAALRINPVSGYPVPDGFADAKKYLGDLDQVEVTGSIFRCFQCGGNLDEETDRHMVKNVGTVGFLMLCESCQQEHPGAVPPEGD